MHVSQWPCFPTGGEGKALPASRPWRAYTLLLWHAQLDGTEEATRQLGDDGFARRINPACKLKPKREVRVRKIPTTEGRGRY